jgi:hypothetical protein
MCPYCYHQFEATALSPVAKTATPSQSSQVLRIAKEVQETSTPSESPIRSRQRPIPRFLKRVLTGMAVVIFGLAIFGWWLENYTEEGREAKAKREEARSLKQRKKEIIKALNDEDERRCEADQPDADTLSDLRRREGQSAVDEVQAASERLLRACLRSARRGRWLNEKTVEGLSPPEVADWYQRYVLTGR